MLPHAVAMPNTPVSAHLDAIRNRRGQFRHIPYLLPLLLRARWDGLSSDPFPQGEQNAWLLNSRWKMILSTICTLWTWFKRASSLAVCTVKHPGRLVVDEHERRLRRLSLKLASDPWGHLAMLDVSINWHANIPRIPL